MIVLISEDINREPDDKQDMSFVINEIHHARKRRKKILPLLVQDTDIPLEINTLEYIDFVQDFTAGKQRLVAYIHNLAGTDTLEEAEEIEVLDTGFLSTTDFSEAETPTETSETNLVSLFGEESEGLDASWLNEESSDLDSSFGEEVEVDISFLPATDFSEESPVSAKVEEDFADLFGEETEGLDTSWLSGETDVDDLADASTEEEPDLGSLFESEAEDNLLGEETLEDEPDDWSTLFAEELSDNTDSETNLAILFSEEEERLDTSWLNEEESDLDSLFGEEVEVDTSFLSATDFGEESPVSAKVEEDFADLFGEETEGLDTSWPSGETDVDDLVDASTEEEPDLGSLFESEAEDNLLGEETLEDEPDDWSTLFAEELSDNTDSETNLAILFSEEEERLDTSWLNEEESDLDSLFGEEVEVDTSFLSATDFGEESPVSAKVEEDFADLFGEETDVDDLLDSLFWGEAEDNLLGEEILEDEPDDWSTLFAEESSDNTDSETNLAILFSEEEERLDTSWLNEEESDLDSLFGEEVEVDTSFLSATDFGEESPVSAKVEEDFADLFGEETEGLDTSWPSGKVSSPYVKSSSNDNSSIHKAQHRISYQMASVITVFILVVGGGIWAVYQSNDTKSKNSTSILPSVTPILTNTIEVNIAPTLESELTDIALVLNGQDGFVDMDGSTNFLNDDWQIQEETLDGIEMVLVPAGCFPMGSEDEESDEQPVHQVCIEEAFWLNKYEVTNGQYGSEGCSDYSTGDNKPRNCISWFDAKDYCESLSGRLPTEAEWEYAARGPDGLIYPWGNEFVAENVISHENADEIVVVGSLANGKSWIGAYDLSGNVWEWTSTIYRDYPYDKKDGREDIDNTNSSHVLRGGSFNSSVFNVRAAYRLRFNPTSDYNYYGFRCARSLN